MARAGFDAGHEVIRQLVSKLHADPAATGDEEKRSVSIIDCRKATKQF